MEARLCARHAICTAPEVFGTCHASCPARISAEDRRAGASSFASKSVGAAPPSARKRAHGARQIRTEVATAHGRLPQMSDMGVVQRRGKAVVATIVRATNLSGDMI